MAISVRAHLLAALIALALPHPTVAQTPPSREAILERVFLTAQTAQASVAGRALTQAGARLAAGDPDLAALLRNRQDLAARILMLDEAMAEAALQSGATGEASVRGIEAEMAAVTARMQALDAAIDGAFPEYRALTDPQPLTLAQLQALLSPDEALVMTMGDAEATWVWAVSPTQAGWHRAPLGRSALEEVVTRLRADLGPGAANRGAAALDGQTPQGPAFDRTLAHALYTDLLGPLDAIIAPAAHLMVVLDGPLTSLPAGLLVTSPPTGADDDPQALRETAWLIRRQAVTTLPTVAGLRTLRRPVPERAGDGPRLMAFGDPLLGYRATEGGELLAMADTGADTVVTRGVYEDIRRVADLAPLPNTARELRALARAVGQGRSTLFLGAEATEARVKAADLSQATILAFATHGLLTGGLPGLDEPALVFTPPEVPDATDDALLTATEAAALNLAADLIILSACDTAGSDGRPGAEGLSGLARAFIYAGARAILVSHWPVDDFAAAQLTVGMVDRMYGPDRLTRAQALRASMLALMDSDTRLAHPSFWAPFVVVGEGGADRS